MTISWVAAMEPPTSWSEAEEMTASMAEAAGMAFAHRFPRTAARIRPAMTTASLGALIALIGFNLQANAGLLVMGAVMVLPWVAGHNATALGLGWLSGLALGFGPAGRRATTFEVGIQNAGLGLVILLSQFGGLGGAAAVTALWGVCHLISGLGLAAVFRLSGRQAAARAGTAM
jgi:bile acid:Na+ symporter, BASS family